MYQPLAATREIAAPRLPDFVAKIEGISHAEPPGRWTDGPVARIRFSRALPRQFTLEFVVAHAYGPNRGLPVTVRVADATKQFVPDADNQRVSMKIFTRDAADTLEFLIPRPTSPASSGASRDTRALGIRLKELRVTSTGG